MNIDKYLEKDYDSSNYNCGHFVAEVYKELTGENVDEICKAYYEYGAGTSDRFVDLFKTRLKLAMPETPCLVIMRMLGEESHAGIYINGKILHLSHTGVKLDDIGLIALHHRLSFYK